MDNWIIFTKLVLLLYIAVDCVQTEIPHISWVVLALLLYFCVNITMYIFKNNNVKRGLHLLSIGISLAAYFIVDPLFCLLFPLTIIELTASFIYYKFVAFILAIIPIWYLNGLLKPLYGLVALLSFIIFSSICKYSDNLMKNEEKLDEMRKSLQKLTRSINENTEYIRQSEYTLKLEERNRISQEIHDKIGHSMTGSLFQMEAAKRLMETDPSKATKLLQNAINISKAGIENIRITLKNLKPPIEQIGIQRMKLLLDHFNSQQQQMKAVLTYDGNSEIISPIQWKVIHENVVEALTNAMKYSDATLISIDLKVLNKLIRVEVKDNGKGTEKIKKGLGIIGMEERAASVNGKMIVDGSSGFSVTTLLPIPT
ncbi:histidine kinase [Bacillus sp. SA1-12]|uniref:sensor histidine kinase n=1 Tax=Bacillus sp. SA1-12 TaxID=1455638 RepID=UPI0006270CEE|nr:sensor histidine kinase [Bacillus sp. SA1-12]KKI89065.1 histidine kinase [Bacillus sp. SA1-12]